MEVLAQEAVAAWATATKAIYARADIETGHGQIAPPPTIIAESAKERDLY